MQQMIECLEDDQVPNHEFTDLGLNELSPVTRALSYVSVLLVVVSCFHVVAAL